MEKEGDKEDPGSKEQYAWRHKDTLFLKNSQYPIYLLLIISYVCLVTLFPGKP